MTTYHAAGDYLSIVTDTSDIFPAGNYTIHGKFDLNSDGFDRTQGDKGFRVDFMVNGNTTVYIEEQDIIDPCFETIISNNRPDLKNVTVYAYMYFPGGDPLKNYAYRFDGGASYVELNYLGNVIGSTMSQDLNKGVYDVLILADMDNSIVNPHAPVMSNGDKYIVVKNIAINGINPIDISGYAFTTYIADVLPAPQISLMVCLNAMQISIKKVIGAGSYRLYGRTTYGYSLIATIIGDSSDYTYYNDFGPNNGFNTYGLPANTYFSYKVAAVKDNGDEGELSPWATEKSDGVQIPSIYADRMTGSTLELLVAIPRYCQEIEITARNNTCGGSLIGKYNFSISEDQRNKGNYFSLTSLTMITGVTYSFTVRGKDMYGVWSDLSSCYLFTY